MELFILPAGNTGSGQAFWVEGRSILWLDSWTILHGSLLPQSGSRSWQVWEGISGPLMEARNWEVALGLQCTLETLPITFTSRPMGTS